MKKRILLAILSLFCFELVGLGALWAAPALDYDVTHITQSPKYFKYSLYEVFDNVGFWSENSGIPYQTQGTENEKRWPQAGESITYTAHVVNKGTMECPPFQYRWLINGTVVNEGAYPHSIPSGYVAEVNWVYPWPAIDHTDHSKDTITFEVLNSDDLPQNNKRTDYSAALSLSIWVDSGQYLAFNQKKNFTGTYSFEDWVQWQVQTMNERFAQATYEGVAPRGILERVRIDKIVVAEHAAGEMGKDPDVRTIDGRWQFTGDGPENYANYANEFAEKIDWGLIHELAHQLGVIDLYRISLNPWDNFVQDDEGKPLNIGMTPFRNPGIMAGGDTSPHNDGSYFSSHDAGFLNANLGYRRGYYGEYLYDIPRNNYIRVLDNQGNPVPNAQVTVYQVATPANRYLSQPMPKGTRVVKVYKNASIFHPGMPVIIAGPDEFFTTIESINTATQEITLADAARIDFGMGSNINRFGGVPGKAKFTGTTDANGLFFIPNEEPYRTITTATKHTLQANPFGTINVVGFNAILYFTVKARGQADSFDLNITDFNLAYWSGQKEKFTYTYQSRIPPAAAPQPPLNLKINGEREKVSLSWESSPAGNLRYNVYRAAYPNYRFEKITPTPIANLNFTEPVDIGWNLRYAVTAVDGSGLESRFSNFVVKPLIVIPNKIASNGNGDRFITDTHPSDGWIIKQDRQNQYQNYLIRFFGRVNAAAVDSQNRLVAASSGNFRILIYDPVSGQLINQFGKDGNQPGQLKEPQGVAVDENYIYVSDSGNHRIQVFTGDSSLIASYGGMGSGNDQFLNPQGIGVDPAGRILVADMGNNRIQILDFDKSSKTITYRQSLTYNFSEPRDVALDANGNIYVADTRNNRLVKFDSNGGFIREFKIFTEGQPQSLSGPQGVAIDKATNLLVIADTGNRRIATIAQSPPAPVKILSSAGNDGTIDPAGAVTVNPGSNQTFTIHANTGCQIQDVKVDGVSKGAISSYTFTSVGANHAIQASFTGQLVITASAGAGGAISPAGKVMVNPGSNQTFKMTPDEGYRMVTVKVDGAVQGAIPSYTFNNITANHSIEVTFEKIPYFQITAKAGVGGTISPSGTISFPWGTNMAFTITANAGYRIADVKVDGISVGAISAYTFQSVKANHTIEATFSPMNSFVITASAGAGGTINPSGAVSVAAGGTQTFTMTPNGGYQILDVKVDGQSKGATNTLTIANVTANHTVEATFILQGDPGPQVVFAVNCGGAQYTDKSGIAYKADINFSAGQTYQTTAPIAGTNDGLLYQSERWGNFSYNIPVTNGNYNVTLKFAELYCSTRNCRLFSVKVEGKEVVTNLDLIAKVGKNRAYDVTTPATVTDGTLNIEFYSADKNAKVNSILITSGQPITQYTLTASAGAGGTISPSGAVSIAAGGTQTFTITPKGGYQILDVKVDGESKGATNTLTIGNVTANHTIEATFRQAPDPVVTASAGVGGTILPSGKVATHWGMMLNFAINPNTGYRIADVKVDGVSQGAISSYTFQSVTANHTIEATFSPMSSFVITASAGAGGTISPSGAVNVGSGGTQTFTMTANAGYRMLDVKVDGESKGATNTLTIANVTANHVVEATFAQVGSGSQVVFAVNCGGPQYTDKMGVVYKADKNFSGGQTYQTTAPIAGTNDGLLYQSERWGNFSYNIPVANGSYNVTLKFAELYCSSVRCRAFSVKVEGKEVISTLDLIAKVGKNRAYDFTTPVTVTDGTLNIEFYNADKNAKVNAILVTSGQ